MADYNALINDIATEVNGFVGASVVDLTSGMALASRTARPDFDLEIASAYNSEMVKGKFRTMEALGLSSELEDMLLTLTDQLHLIKMIDNTTFMYMAAEKGKTNLALLRTVVNAQFKKHGLI